MNIEASDTLHGAIEQELSVVCEANGYPDKENLKDNDKLLRLLDRAGSLCLWLFFNLVFTAIPESTSKFQAFSLT